MSKVLPVLLLPPLFINMNRIDWTELAEYSRSIQVHKCIQYIKPGQRLCSSVLVRADLYHIELFFFVWGGIEGTLCFHIPFCTWKLTFHWQIWCWANSSWVALRWKQVKLIYFKKTTMCLTGSVLLRGQRLCDLRAAALQYLAWMSTGWKVKLTATSHTSFFFPLPPLDWWIPGVWVWQGHILFIVLIPQLHNHKISKTLRSSSRDGGGLVL